MFISCSTKKSPPTSASSESMAPFSSAQQTNSMRLFLALHELPPIVILRLRNMTAIDSTGLQALEKFADQVHESGRKLILCGAREQAAKGMQEAGLHSHLGRQNVCFSVTEALDRAKSIRPEPSEKCALARGEKTLLIP